MSGESEGSDKLTNDLQENKKTGRLRTWDWLSASRIGNGDKLLYKFGVLSVVPIS